MVVCTIIDIRPYWKYIESFCKPVWKIYEDTDLSQYLIKQKKGFKTERV